MPGYGDQSQEEAARRSGAVPRCPGLGASGRVLSCEDSGPSLQPGPPTGTEVGESSIYSAPFMCQACGSSSIVIVHPHTKWDVETTVSILLLGNRSSERPTQPARGRLGVTLRSG